MPLKCTRNINASLTFRCRYNDGRVCVWFYYWISFQPKRPKLANQRAQSIKMRMHFPCRCTRLHHLMLFLLYFFFYSAWTVSQFARESFIFEMWQRPNRHSEWNALSYCICVIASQVFYVHFESCLCDFVFLRLKHKNKTQHIGSVWLEIIAGIAWPKDTYVCHVYR